MGKLHRFVFGSGFYGVVLILLSSGTVILTSLTVSPAQEATPPPLTQLELQSELMGFADRLSMFLAQATTRDPEFRTKPALYNDQILIFFSCVYYRRRTQPGSRPARHGGVDHPGAHDL